MNIFNEGDQFAPLKSMSQAKKKKYSRHRPRDNSDRSSQNQSLRKSDLIFTPDRKDIDAIRNQIIEHKVASRMDQIFKSKDGDQSRAESTPVVISEQEELKKTDELSIPKIDLEKLGIGVYKKDKPQNQDYSNHNSYTDLPMINKQSKFSRIKRHKLKELRSFSVLHSRVPSNTQKRYGATNITVSNRDSVLVDDPYVNSQQQIMLNGVPNQKFKKGQSRKAKNLNMQTTALHLQPRDITAAQMELDKEMAKVKGRLNKLKNNYRQQFSSTQMDKLKEDPYKT